MKLNQLAERTGTDKRNIRFYDREGLILRAPGTRDYTRYTDQEVEAVRRIVLLRKLGISVRNIQFAARGYFTLPDVLQQHLAKLEQEPQPTHSGIIKILKELLASQASFRTLPAERYLQQMDDLAARGEFFYDVSRDYHRKGSWKPPFAKEYFEPDDPIITKADFTLELLKYGEKNGKTIQILRESMAPILLIDGEKYHAQLENPHSLHFPFSFFFAARTYGYRWVYLYKLDDLSSDQTA